MASPKFRVIIVGGGPVGLYLANALAATNIDFIVLEQQPTVLNYSGALIFTWPQSVRLLDQIGVYEAANKAAYPMHAKKRVFGRDGSVMTTSHFWGLMREKCFTNPSPPLPCIFVVGIALTPPLQSWVPIHAAAA